MRRKGRQSTQRVPGHDLKVADYCGDEIRDEMQRMIRKKDRKILTRVAKDAQASHRRADLGLAENLMPREDDDGAVRVAHNQVRISKACNVVEEEGLDGPALGIKR